MADPEIMGGVPCVAGTRIPLSTILGLLWEGVTPAEILGYYPQLVIDDVHARTQFARQTGNRLEPDQRTPPAHDE